MILRKPYAFIIKHFRLLHIILLICFVFLFNHTSDLYRLFVNLQATNTFTYSGATMYVNNIIYLAAIIALCLSALLYWLLRVKKKPTLFYLLMISLTIVVTISNIYFSSVLGTLEERAIPISQIIVLKDILFLIRIPELGAIVLCLIRGIGFNIKKFNFSKDVEELQIADKDSDEFELLIGQNNYKYKRLIRRAIRETKYYIIENKFAITCFSGILLLILFFYGINVYNTYIKKYGESESSVVNNIAYTVKNSYLTAEDYNGQEIKNGYKFVVVEVSLYNVSSFQQEIDLSKMVLANRQLLYYPTLNQNSKFYDLGTPIKNKQVIQGNSSVDVTLTYEIPYSVTTNSLSLKVQYIIENRATKIITHYKNFDINLKDIDTKLIENNVNLGESINTNVNNENPFNLTIKDYELKDTYNNSYVLCNKNLSCRSISSIIKSSTNDISSMLVLSIDSTIFDEAKFTHTFNSINEVFEKFATLKYQILNTTFEEKVNIVPLTNVDGKVFINVPRKIYNATSIELVFNFRNNKYYVKLR